jgi:hypothetical protein
MHTCGTGSGRESSVTPQQLEALKRQYAGKRVVVDPARPEVARWAGVPGVIKAINFSGRALVQFDGPDLGWHDLDLAVLRLAGSAEAEADEKLAKALRKSAAAGPKPAGA